MKPIKSLPIIIMLIVAGCIFQAYCQQIKIGVEDSDQYWHTVSSDPGNYKKTLKGKIDDLFLYNPWPWSDDDWNISIIPDFGYEYLLRNSKGNVTQRGTVQGEIRNDFPVSKYFSVGESVTLYGWWVQDSGHDSNGGDEGGIDESVGGRTEIHPIIHMSGDIRNETGKGKKFLMLQDDTERFHNSITSPAIARVSYPIKPNPDYAIKNLNKIENSLSVPTSIVSERAIIDNGGGTHDAVSVMWWNRFKTKIDYDIRHSSIDVTGTMYSTNMFPLFIHPFAYFEFTTGGREPIAERYWYEINAGNIVINLELRFNNPKIIATPLSDIKRYPHVNWEYLSNSSSGNLGFKHSSEDIVRLKFIYSPKQGNTNTNWHVELFASTIKPLKWNPGIRTESDRSGEASRKMVFFERDYKISPSEVKINVTKPLEPDQLDVTSSFKPCFPEIKLETPITYSISVIRLGDGTLQTAADQRFIPISTELSTPDFKCTRNTVDNSLHFVFQNKLLGGDAATRFQNSAKLILRATAKTTLGEQLIYDEEILAPAWKSKAELALLLTKFTTVIMAVDFLGTNIPRWDIADINYSPLPVTFDNACALINGICYDLSYNLYYVK